MNIHIFLSSLTLDNSLIKSHLTFTIALCDSLLYKFLDNWIFWNLKKDYVFVDISETI